MKRPFLFVLFFSPFLAAFSQNARFIDVPSGSRVLDILREEDLYAYPAFTSGTVTYRNGKTKAALLNFNVLLGEMQILQNNDTLSLHGSGVLSVTLGGDNFELGSYFLSRKRTPFNLEVETFYFKVERDYGKMRLASKKVFAFVKRTPLPDDSTRFNLSYRLLNSGRFLKDVAPVDTLHLAVLELFYIANVKNELMPVHRSALTELYPYKEKAIEDYLRRHPVSVYDKESVLALLDFVTEKIYNR